MRASERYVTVIIRRPHAYDFLKQEFMDRVAPGAEIHAGEAGIEVGELSLPIPGLYVLDTQGEPVAQSGFPGHDEVLAFLTEHARP